MRHDDMNRHQAGRSNEARRDEWRGGEAARQGDVGGHDDWRGVQGYPGAPADGGGYDEHRTDAGRGYVRGSDFDRGMGPGPEGSRYRLTRTGEPDRFGPAGSGGYADGASNDDWRDEPRRFEHGGGYGGLSSPARDPRVRGGYRGFGASDAGDDRPRYGYGYGDADRQRDVRDEGMGGSRQHRFDPDYRQWRNEQMRKLDEDYDEWRRDRYKKFSDEFTQWRSNRPQPSAPASSSAASMSNPPNAGAAHDTAGSSKAGTK